MLEQLAQYEEIWGPLRLFRYLTFRGAMGLATAMFISFAFAPVILRALRGLKASQVLRDASEVRELADLHASKKDTPTMGGLIIFVGIVPSVLLWAELNVYVLVALLVYTGLTVTGFCDDYLKITKKNAKGLSSRKKLIAQTLLTGLAVLILFYHPESGSAMRELWVPFYKHPVIEWMPLWFGALFFFFVMAGSSNAINLTDGVDGLAIGCTISVVLAYAIMAYITGNAIWSDYLFIRTIPGSGELTVVCMAVLGSSLAFLWYNCYPAEVFMGDTGSLALGGLIGTIAFMVHEPFTLVIIGGIFVIEALSVILQVGSFKMRGKRIFRMAPIHHHFELKGWAESKVIVRFWILSLLFALAGLGTLKLR